MANDMCTAQLFSSNLSFSAPMTAMTIVTDNQTSFQTIQTWIAGTSPTVAKRMRTVNCKLRIATSMAISTVCVAAVAEGAHIYSLQQC